MVFGSYLPSSTKKATIKKNIKNAVEIGAPRTKLSGSAHGWDLSFDLILYLYMQVIKALAGQLGCTFAAQICNKYQNSLTCSFVCLYRQHKK